MSLYHALLLQRSDDGPVWRSLGEIEAPSAATARRRALERERLPSGTVQATPLKSWKPELLTTETITRYVSGSSVAAEPAPTAEAPKAETFAAASFAEDE